MEAGRWWKSEEETTLWVEAGPTAPTRLSDIEIDPASDTVTLAWSSVEGGQYVVSTSSDLETWTPTGDSVGGTPGSMSMLMEVGDAPQKFFAVTRESLAEYDSEGSAGGGPGGGAPGAGGPPDGGPGGAPAGQDGGGPQPGTGNPVDGFVFSFGDVPPQQNLALNVRVGGVEATVVDFFSQGPQGGTLTLRFDDSGFASGATVAATYSHEPPGRGTIVETSTNAYTKP